MNWLGIDVGTGGTRALLIDEPGHVLHSATVSHAPMRMARPLWAEQSPQDWWRAASEAIRTVLNAAGVAKEAIRGIGLSGQMHGLVMLDASGEVIRDSLIWCDQRSQTEVDEIHTRVGLARMLTRTANPAITGFTLPKLLWVRRHDPASFGRLATVLLPKDYVRFRLTGDRATDVSDASGTGIFDVAHRKWSEVLSRDLDLDPAIWPRAVESDEITGHVSREAARATGLAEGTPVVGGAGDQAASAVGNGIVSPGVVSCTIGTSGVVFAHTDSPAYDEKGRVHTFCHAARRAWHVMGVTQGAGLSLQWFRNTLAPGADYDTLTEEAAGTPAGSDGLYWLPYLMGERTPHLDARARGGWVGLTARHSRAHLIRALLEGVSYSQKDGADVILGMGVPITRVRASGGGARSAFWRQMLADVFDRPVAVLATEEGSAFGAALLAMSGTGEAGSLVEIADRVTVEVGVSEPVPDRVEAYARGHEVYRSLYPALSGFYQTST
jgi:xylulokinase